MQHLFEVAMPIVKEGQVELWRMALSARFA
jgi:hypothetical protein